MTNAPDNLVEQIRAFLADAPKGLPHEGYRYGELLAQSTTEMVRLRERVAELELTADLYKNAGSPALMQVQQRAERAEARVAALEAENGNSAQQYAKLKAERDLIKDSLRQANGVRDVFASAVIMQAMQEVDKMPNTQGSQVDKSTKLQGPDPDGVICPNCVHQFHAIPENVQARLRVAKADRDEWERKAGQYMDERDALRAQIAEQAQEIEGLRKDAERWCTARSPNVIGRFKLEAWSSLDHRYNVVTGEAADAAIDAARSKS